ncbi:hypothetical protein [Bacillus paramycoides]|uniref:hypothetical protein n=1 Tax=Bacillus paramycoides TaxID=2026194 RepID=UPI003D19F069
MCVVNAVMTVCTDATIYGPNATSVDVKLKPGIGTEGWNRTYMMNLQYLSGGKWLAVGSHSGSFKYGATVQYPLSGKQAGTYRLVIDYKLYDGSGAYKQSDTLHHPDFAVRR